ncbi:MAG: DUF2442 domain-containing protein [Planctomycetaceae bacterium]
MEPLQRFSLRLTFDDGFVRVIDMEQWLRGSVFEPIRSNEAYFRSVHLEGGTIAWANGAGFCPDVLRHEALWPDFVKSDSTKIIRRNARVQSGRKPAASKKSTARA